MPIVNILNCEPETNENSCDNCIDVKDGLNSRVLIKRKKVWRS
jgi:hypothetical protein